MGANRAIIAKMKISVNPATESGFLIILLKENLTSLSLGCSSMLSINLLFFKKNIVFFFLPPENFHVNKNMLMIIYHRSIFHVVSTIPIKSIPNNTYNNFQANFTRPVISNLYVIFTQFSTIKNSTFLFSGSFL